MKIKNKFNFFISALFISPIISSPIIYFVLNKQNETNKSSIKEKIKEPIKDNNNKKYETITWEGIEIPKFKESLVEEESLKTNYKEIKMLGSIFVKLYPFEDGTFYLDDASFQKFIDNLETTLAYGPEIFGLKGIEINNDGNKNYFDTGNRKIHIGEQKNTHRSNKEKINSLLFNAFHEYGHYLEHAYVRDYEDSQISISLTNLGALEVKEALEANEEIPSPSEYFINEKFLTKFKKILHFDDDQQLTNKWANQTEFEFTNDYNEKEIVKTAAGRYNAKELWDFVNESKELNYKVTKEQEKYILGTKETVGSSVKKLFDFNTYYEYSFEEIFTRRYLGLLFKGITGKPKLKNENGIIFYENFIKSSTFQDGPKTDGTNPVWLESSPYGQNEASISSWENKRSSKLYNTLRKMMGQYNGSDISWMIGGDWFKERDIEKIKDKEFLKILKKAWLQIQEKLEEGVEMPSNVVEIMQKYSFYTIPEKTKELKLGGYISNDDITNKLQINLDSFNQKTGIVAKLGYQDTSGTIIPLNKDIKIHKYNVKKIDSWLNNEYENLRDGDNYFWVINNNDSKQFKLKENNSETEFGWDYKGDFISFDDIENKKLVLYNPNNTNQKIALKTTRTEMQNSDNEYGKTTSFYSEKNGMTGKPQEKYYKSEEVNGWSQISEFEI